MVNQSFTLFFKAEDLFTRYRVEFVEGSVLAIDDKTLVINGQDGKNVNIYSGNLDLQANFQVGDDLTIATDMSGMYAEGHYFLKSLNNRTHVVVANIKDRQPVPNFLQSLRQITIERSILGTAFFFFPGANWFVMIFLCIGFLIAGLLIPLAGPWSKFVTYSKHVWMAALYGFLAVSGFSYLMEVWNLFIPLLVGGPAVGMLTAYAFINRGGIAETNKAHDIIDQRIRVIRRT